MRRLSTRVADELAWPMVRSTVGDVRKMGLQKLRHGPNTQMAPDHHVPLLDIGTMEQIKQGHVAVHGDLDRFTEDGVVCSAGSRATLDAEVLATGYRASIGEFFVGWKDVCDRAGTPTVSGAPMALQGRYFCGLYVSPAGMLREIGIEAARIADHPSV